MVFNDLKNIPFFKRFGSKIKQLKYDFALQHLKQYKTLPPFLEKVFEKKRKSFF